LQLAAVNCRLLAIPSALPRCVDKLTVTVGLPLLPVIFVDAVQAEGGGGGSGAPEAPHGLTTGKAFKQVLMSTRPPPPHTHTRTHAHTLVLYLHPARASVDNWWECSPHTGSARPRWGRELCTGLVESGGLVVA
jgi:hypothetical protein